MSELFRFMMPIKKNKVGYESFCSVLNDQWIVNLRDPKKMNEKYLNLGKHMDDLEKKQLRETLMKNIEISEELLEEGEERYKWETRSMYISARDFVRAYESVQESKTNLENLRNSMSNLNE